MSGLLLVASQWASVCCTCVSRSECWWLMCHVCRCCCCCCLTVCLCSVTVECFSFLPRSSWYNLSLVICCVFHLILHINIFVPTFCSCVMFHGLSLHKCGKIALSLMAAKHHVLNLDRYLHMPHYKIGISDSSNGINNVKWLYYHCREYESCLVDELLLSWGTLMKLSIQDYSCCLSRLHCISYWCVAERYVVTWEIYQWKCIRNLIMKPCIYMLHWFLHSNFRSPNLQNILLEDFIKISVFVITMAYNSEI